MEYYFMELGIIIAFHDREALLKSWLGLKCRFDVLAKLTQLDWWLGILQPLVLTCKPKYGIYNSHIVLIKRIYSAHLEHI